MLFGEEYFPMSLSLILLTRMGEIIWRGANTEDQR